MISRIVIVLVVASSYASAHPVLAASAADSAKISRARATLNRFFAAYARRNVPGVLASLTKNADVGDCDYSRHVVVDIDRTTNSGHTLSRWLNTKFRENDQLKADVAHATIDVEHGHPVAGISNRRTSDSIRPLVQRGSLDFSVAFKFILNRPGNLIEHIAMSSQAECPAGTLPQGAMPEQQQSLGQSFLTSYNNHDLEGVLNVLADDVSYHDCDYRNHSQKILTGQAEVTAWLRQRFAENEHFTGSKIVADSWFSQFNNPPTTTVVRTVRQSDSLVALSASSHPVTLVILPDASVSRIQSVTAWESCSERLLAITGKPVHGASHPDITVGKTYPYSLWSHCAVDTYTKFDGSFWRAVAPPWTQSSVPRHRGLGFNYTQGFMTLLNRVMARFTFKGGYVLFVRRPHTYKPRGCS